MTALKRLRTALIRVLVGSVETEHTELMKRIPAPVVVLGFPRSGTSLVGQLMAKAGYSFGDSPESMAADTRNPRGYFEHGPLFRLSRQFLREAGVKGDLDPVPEGFRARGLISRLQRAFTRRAMMRVLDDLAATSPFGIKLFPRFYYFWKQYLPANTKIVAIYREPEAVVRSFMTAWPGGRYTADQALSLWAEHNRDMLFQLSDSSSAFLMKYEDLLDPALQPRVLAALATYLGVPENVLEGVVEASLNRSRGKDGELPLLPAVRDALEALEARRGYNA